MKIAQVHSHLGGQESILVHQPEIWDEVESVVSAVDAESSRTRSSEGTPMRGRGLYGCVSMNKAFDKELSSRGWHASKIGSWITTDRKLVRDTMALPPNEQQRQIMEANENPYFAYDRTDYLKERIAIGLGFGKSSFVAYDLFARHMAFFVGDAIDVGVEILPMKELQAQMSPHWTCYEGELYNLIRQGRGVPAVPLVLIGVAP